MALPAVLNQFYRQSNGLVGPHGDMFVMPIQKLVKTNIEHWLNDDYEDQYMPLESLLFFASRGDGDLFAFSILGEKIQENKIYRWERATDSRIFYAENLEQYLYKRWKCFQEDNERFWDLARDCKDFDDYKVFLRWCREADQSSFA